MYLTTETKREIFKEHGGSDKNTGGSESQIALFTTRINHLTGHLKVNKKEQLLNSLKMYDIERYRAIIGKLGLRK